MQYLQDMIHESGLTSIAAACNNKHASGNFTMKGDGDVVFTSFCIWKEGLTCPAWTFPHSFCPVFLSSENPGVSGPRYRLFGKPCPCRRKKTAMKKQINPLNGDERKAMQPLWATTVPLCWALCLRSFARNSAAKACFLSAVCRCQKYVNFKSRLWVESCRPTGSGTSDESVQGCSELLPLWVYFLFYSSALFCSSTWTRFSEKSVILEDSRKLYTLSCTQMHSNLHV